MSEEQTYLLRQSRLKAVRDANQAQNGIAKPEPKRKPMTEEEIKNNVFYIFKDEFECFVKGIRFAEKHHGIT
jgi:hypothetical protein